MRKIFTASLVGCMAVSAFAGQFPNQLKISQPQGIARGVDVKSNIMKNGKALKLSSNATNGKQRAAQKGPEYTFTQEDLIYAPQGEAKTYLKACDGWYLFYGMYLVDYEEDSVISTIYETENGEVYFENILSYYSGAYVKGQRDGDKITVTLPQAVDYSDYYDAYIYLTKLNISADEEGYLDAAIDGDNLTLTYTVGEDGTLVMEDLGEDNAIGLVWNDDSSWTGYADYHQSYSPFSFELEEIPEAADQKSYVSIADGYGYPVTVAFDGDTVYIKGLSESMPDGIFKGTLKDGKVSIPQDQIVGIYGSYLMYAKVAETTMDEEGNETFVLTPSDEAYELIYDAENQTLKSSNPDKYLLVNGKKDTIYYLDYFNDFELSYQASAAGTPVNPTDLSWNDDYYEDYGYYSFIFVMPNVSNGVVLNGNDLYYRIFVDDELWEFYEDDSEYYGLDLMGLDGTTELPYLFSNGNDIYSWDSTMREVGIYPDGVTTIGVQAVYKYEGVTTVSDIVTLDIETGEISTGVNSIATDNNVKSVRYYDLNGLEVSKPSKGIVIERQTLENGDIKFVKRVARK
jgi:hypothetical protein